MQDHIADLVHPVFRHGLQLKEQLEQGKSPSFELEQATLKGMLLTELEAQRYREFGGDGSLSSTLTADEQQEIFLGIRFALTCWLDELFILHSPWSNQWNERKLEVALYQSNDRAWRFWQQARLAEKQPTTDALEAYFLCVMLGFRGELLEQAEQLHTWCNTTQARLAQTAETWPHPPELEPPTNVPPLRGQDWFQTMLFWTVVLLLVFVPLASFLVVQNLSSS